MIKPKIHSLNILVLLLVCLSDIVAADSFRANFDETNDRHINEPYSKLEKKYNGIRGQQSNSGNHLHSRELRKFPPAASKEDKKLRRESRWDFDERFVTLPPNFAPSDSPTSSPTEIAEQAGYYRQFDRPIRVACVGDSLTRGRDTPGEEYPTFLNEYLGSTFEIGNFGSRRATAIRGLTHSYSMSGMYQLSLDYEADVYLIMLGTNDIRFWEDQAHLYPPSLKWHIQKARESSPGVRVMLALPPWIQKDSSVFINSVMLNNVIPEVRKVAVSEGVQLVDIYGATEGQNSGYLGDGVHFNGNGNKIIAEAWKQAIACNQNGFCEVGESCITCPEDCNVNCPPDAPSSQPSESPSSRPTAVSENAGYYRQFDRPIRVACAGDSLTRGRSFPGEEYPTFLSEYLGESFETGNFGSRAATAMRGQQNSYSISGMYQFSLDYEADIYLLMLGTNDINFWQEAAHLYPAGLQWHIQKARDSSPGVRVMLALPPWIKRGNDVVKNSVMLNNVIPEVRKVAQAEGLQVVDIYGATEGQDSAYVSDGVHFNPEGNRIMAVAWKAAIECNPNGVCEVGESCRTCPQDCNVNCP